MNSWWEENKKQGRTTILFGYSLGKAQRLLNGLDQSIGKVFVHGAIYNTNEALRNDGINLHPYEVITKDTPKSAYRNELILAPPSAMGTPWLKKFMPYASGIASGWMAVRGARRRRAVDRGFVLSDHADWSGLLEAVKATSAQKVYVTHGYSAMFSRYLNENGIESAEVKTEFEGEILN